MYKLARMHLDSVGASAARFSALTLDFTDDSHRPLDTIVWLRNGGGKTTVLSLLFSLFLPYRRDFLGYREDRRTLGDYVLNSDTSHVVCEWETLDGPLVTGAVYEWPERRRPAEHEKHAGELVTRFYAFSSKPGVLSFEDRPTRDSAGRRRPLDAYVRELRTIGRAHPMTGLVVATTGTEWSRALVERGIDPAVFRYQREMNKGEGAIDEQFRFATGEAFVNFLIEMAVDAEASDSVSERMGQLAGKLAARPRTEEELAYCEGVAERLRPMATAWEDLRRHRSELDEATTGARRLAGALRAGSAVAGADEAAAEAERAEATRQRVAAETARTAAGGRAREYGRRAAEFWVAEAEDRLKGLDEERAGVEAEQSGWAALEDLFATEDAQARIDAIDRQLSEKAAEGEPLRVARNKAARRLYWRRHAQHERTATERDETSSRADTLEKEAERQEAEAREADIEGGRLEASIAALEREIGTVDAALARAVAAGHLAQGEDPAGALERARRAEADALGALDRLETGVTKRTARQRQLVGELADLERRAGEVRFRREATHTEHEKLKTEAAGLARHPRLCELAQTDSVSLWGAGQLLDVRLGEEVQRAEDGLVHEEVAAARDRRNRAALGEGGLLPPSADTEAMLGVLEAAGIPATSGLAYLSASVARRQWETTIEAHPGLLSGILVDVGDFERARAALIAAGLHPASLVTLAKKSDLAGNGESAFVVPPSPALYDTASADTERDVLDERLAGLARRKAVLEASMRADRDLRAHLARFLSCCPTGHLDTLAQRITEDDRVLAGLDSRRLELGAESEEIDSYLSDAARRREELSAERLARRDQVQALERLAADMVRRPELVDQHTAATERRAAVHAQARAAADSAAESRRLSIEARLAVQALGGRLSELARELAAVELRGEDDWGDASEWLPAAGEPTEALAAELTRLDEAYRGAVSDPVLEDRRERAAADRARAQEKLSQRSGDALARADSLRAEPAAADASSRAQRVATLEQRRADLLTENGKATNELARARDELEERSRQRGRELTTDEEPTDRADADHRRKDAEAESTRRSKEVTEAEARVEEAGARQQAAKSRRDLLEVLAKGLEDLVTTAIGPVEAEAPFPGSDEDAKSAQGSASSELRAAAERFGATETRLNRAAGEVRTFAAHVRFEAVDELRQAILEGEPMDLGRRAEELAGHHTERAAVLRADLAAISEDQKILVADLSHQVRRVLDLLKKAPQTSVMHPSLGEWANRSFLTIGFDDVSAQPDEMARRVSAEVDTIVAKGNVPDGISTLQRAVHATVPGGFKVRVLKPTADLHEERVPVSTMAKWSGGEKLTAAVVLYCIIARLRARNRSRELLAGSSGALMLDNPLGKSNYVGFLAVQRRVAEALDVQLLYTTAVRDLKAVGTFPNVIRCRNRRALNTDRGYVTAEERAGEAHGTSLAGMVSSARVVRLDPPRAALLPEAGPLRRREGDDEVESADVTGSGGVAHGAG